MVATLIGLIGVFVLFFGVLIGVGITVSALQQQLSVKGSFVVRGYKDGELKFVKEYIDESFTVVPGDKFDKIEILN